MRIAALAFCLLAACANLPPAQTPYFAAAASGDNLYPATETRIYQNDRKVLIEKPHPANNERGRRTFSDAPGAFAFGLTALEDPELPPTPQNTVLAGPDACCHVYVQRDFFYFDGIRRIGIPESVWRQAASIPPFVDLPILPN